MQMAEIDINRYVDGQIGVSCLFMEHDTSYVVSLLRILLWCMSEQLGGDRQKGQIEEIWKKTGMMMYTSDHQGINCLRFISTFYNVFSYLRSCSFIDELNQENVPCDGNGIPEYEIQVLSFELDHTFVQFQFIFMILLI